MPLFQLGCVRACRQSLAFAPARANWSQSAVFYATRVSGSYSRELKLHSDPCFVQEIGQTFCDNNTNSTGKTYTQANGDYYDANYPW